MKLWERSLLQIGDKQGLMVNVTIQANFRRICMESSEQTGAYIYPPICTNRLIFDNCAFFHLVLSEFANQSHNFTSLNFLTSIFSSLLLIPTNVDRLLLFSPIPPLSRSCFFLYCSLLPSLGLSSQSTAYSRKIF